MWRIAWRPRGARTLTQVTISLSTYKRRWKAVWQAIRFRRLFPQNTYYIIPA